MGIVKTIRTALSEPPEETAGVINKGPKASENQSVSFWVGKRGQLSWGERIKRELGWRDESAEGVYNEDFFRGMVREAARWGSATITVCPVFSEIFNGKNDLKKSVSVDKQIAELEGLKARIAPEANIRIRNLEDVEAHQDFFSYLREFVNEGTGKFDPDAFREHISALADEPNLRTTIGIFQTLVQATDEAKGKDLFSKKLQNCRTAHYADDEASAFYPLAEIAVRMHELVYSNATVQGGGDWQGSYDSVIDVIKSLKPKKSRNEPLNKLHTTLFEKTRDFYKTYIKVEDAHAGASFDRATARRGQARRRIGAAAIALLAGRGMYEYGNHLAEVQEREARIDALYNNYGPILKLGTYYKDYGPLNKFEPDEVPIMVRQKIAHIKTEILLRYSEFERIDDVDLERIILEKITSTILEREAAYRRMRRNDEFIQQSSLIPPNQDLRPYALLASLVTSEVRFNRYPDLTSIDNPLTAYNENATTEWVDQFVHEHSDMLSQAYNVKIGPPYDHIFTPSQLTNGFVPRRAGAGKFCSTESKSQCFWVSTTKTITGEWSYVARPFDSSQAPDSAYGELAYRLYQRSLHRHQSELLNSAGSFLNNCAMNSRQLCPDEDLAVDPNDENFQLVTPLPDFTSFSGDTYEVIGVAPPIIEFTSPSPVLLARPKGSTGAFTLQNGASFFGELYFGIEPESYCHSTLNTADYSPFPSECESLWPEDLQIQYDDMRWPIPTAAKSSQTTDSGASRGWDYGYEYR